MTDSRTEDPELVARLAKGDREALAALFAQHRDRLRRMIEFRLHPRLLRRIDPDDVLQDAWLDAVLRIDSYAQQRDPSCYLWLRLVVGQTLIDLHRRHLGAQMRDMKLEVPMHRPGGPAMSSDVISMHLSGGFTSPSGAAARAEQATLLRQVLDQMDDIDREILVLRHLEEMTNAEVSKLLDLQPTAASNRYVRALTRLKGLLADKPGLRDPSD
ncbi:MAG: sigma-70 family RNA polymerase sigma factor [Planctomycetes bacterium]|nr:sigma-70 family RNA polymerase sigma factor [Planctomycetota bacterium]